MGIVEDEPVSWEPQSPEGLVRGGRKKKRTLNGWEPKHDICLFNVSCFFAFNFGMSFRVQHVFFHSELNSHKRNGCAQMVTLGVPYSNSLDGIPSSRSIWGYDLLILVSEIPTVPWFRQCSWEVNFGIQLKISITSSFIVKFWWDGINTWHIC